MAVRVDFCEDGMKLVRLTDEEKAGLPSLVLDTLRLGQLAVCEGVTYAADEDHAREKLAT